MQSPFSPFVGRRVLRKELKRRQSELPSDLIDWDGPEIPELEKQRMIYEELLKEVNEDHIFETLLNEEIISIAAEAQIETANRLNEEKLLKERSQVNLLLGQLKMFQDHSQEAENHIKELEASSKILTERNEQMESSTKDLEQAKTKLETQVEELQSKVESLDEQYKELEFRNKELEADADSQLDLYMTKWSEAEEFKRQYESAKCLATYYKKLAKGDANKAS